MRRFLLVLLPSLFAITLLAATTLTATSPAYAAPIAGAPTTYCGDPDTDPSMSTGAGTMITCDTTITNTITGIDPVTGVASGSAVISVTECVGPASGRLDPSFLTCSTDDQSLVNLVTSVDQCNGVGYGGGNVLECDVDVINNFVAVIPAVVSAATVNQCNGSAPDTTGCNPFPASTTNATITQCNNSSYGGGQEDFNCIASGTTTASLIVLVNQCNDSNYGGGSWLNCSASLTNNVIPAAATPTPAPTATATLAPAAAATPVPASTPAPAASPAASVGAGAITLPVAGSPVPSLPDTSFSDQNPEPWIGPGGLMLAGLVLLVSLSLIATSKRQTS